jgi:hypothetical protein
MEDASQRADMISRRMNLRILFVMPAFMLVELAFMNMQHTANFFARPVLWSLFVCVYLIASWFHSHARRDLRLIHYALWFVCFNMPLTLLICIGPDILKAIDNSQ